MAQEFVTNTNGWGGHYANTQKDAFGNTVNSQTGQVVLPVNK